MADGVFLISKGEVNEIFDRVADNDPAAGVLSVVLLTVNQADATLEAHATLSALLAAANTEATFTSYVRQVLTDADIVNSVVNGTNKESTLPAVTWASATTGQTMTKLLVCFDPLGTDVDANMIPLTQHDFTPTTDGSDLVTVAGVVFRAA